jgi:hypothetical protein
MKIVAIFCLILGYTMLYDGFSRFMGSAYTGNTVLGLLGYTSPYEQNDIINGIFGVKSEALESVPQTNQSSTLGDNGNSGSAISA